MRYMAKDGQFYDTATEAQGASARYEQQERRNNLLKEQNDLIRKQQEDQKRMFEKQEMEAERRARQQDFSLKYEPNPSYYSDSEPGMSDEEYQEILKEERLEKLRDLAPMTLKRKLDKDIKDVENINNKIGLIKKIENIKQTENVSINKIKRNCISILILFILFTLMIFTASPIFLFLFIIYGIFSIYHNTEKSNEERIILNKKLKEAGESDLFDELPQTIEELTTLRNELEQEIEDLEEVTSEGNKERIKIMIK